MDEELTDFQIVDRIPPVNGAGPSRLRRFLARQGLMFTQVIARAISFAPPRRSGGCEFRSLSGDAGEISGLDRSEWLKPVCLVFIHKQHLHQGMQ
jgi:hypothetical protein